MNYNALHYIKLFWSDRLRDFFTEERILAIFNSECTNGLFFNQDKLLSNLDLLTVQNVAHFICIDIKRIPEFPDVRFSTISDDLPELLSGDVRTSQLVTNFIVFEKWANETYFAITNFIEDSTILKEKLDSVLNISKFSDEEQINAFIDVFEKKFDREDIIYAIKNNPTKFNLITLKQLLIQKMIKNTNITYYSYKLMFEEQLEIQSYDQLSKFELYYNICH